MTAPARRTVRVVAALIPRPDDGRQFLVQQRLPGGKVEAGESDEAALARECREELDVDLAVGRRLWEGKHTYPDLTVELVLYLSRIVSGEPRPLGAHALAFQTPAQMLSLPFCEADIPLLDDLVAGRLGSLD